MNINVFYNSWNFLVWMFSELNSALPKPNKLSSKSKGRQKKNSGRTQRSGNLIIELHNSYLLWFIVSYYNDKY